MGFNSGFKGLSSRRKNLSLPICSPLMSLWLAWDWTGKMQQAWVFFLQISTSEEEVIKLSLNVANNIYYPATWRHIAKERAPLYSYSTTNKMHLLSQIMYYCKTLYMFRTVFPSISRSSKLRIQQLFDIYRCCIRSFKLLMMDGKTVWNMYSVLQEYIIWDNRCILLVVL